MGIRRDFYELTKDSTFKAYCKGDETGKIFKLHIGELLNRDLSEYQFYDPNLNSGNDRKDEELDLLMIDNFKEPFNGEIINIEMESSHTKDGMTKSIAYLVRLIDTKTRKGKKYNTNSVTQIVLIDDKLDGYEDGILHFNYYDKNKNIELSEVHFGIKNDRYEVYLENYKGIKYNDGRSD